MKHPKWHSLLKAGKQFEDNDEAAELGVGASTRSGGGVSGGVNIGKSFTGA